MLRLSVKTTISCFFMCFRGVVVSSGLPWEAQDQMPQKPVLHQSRKVEEYGHGEVKVRLMG